MDTTVLALPAEAAAINAHYDALEAALQAEIAKTGATIKRLMRDAVNAADAAKLTAIKVRIAEQESLRRRLQRDIFTRTDEIDQQREAALNALAPEVQEAIAQAKLDAAKKAEAQAVAQEAIKAKYADSKTAYATAQYRRICIAYMSRDGKMCREDHPGKMTEPAIKARLAKYNKAGLPAHLETTDGTVITNLRVWLNQDIIVPE